MGTDWKSVAVARKLGIPADELERIVPVLEALETNFRPLLERLQHETEPCYHLSEGAVTVR